MYPYNPLVHYNSDGKCNPVFHLAERLETRSLNQYLIDLESVDTTKALNVFKTEKQEAINIYVEKLKWLELLKADNEIITWQRKFIDDWEYGLMSNEKLKDLYDLEMVRSLNLDIQDDISGKSCTTNTIKKADKLLEIINLNFDIVKQSDLIQSPGKNITQGEMLKRHYQIKKTIEKYIIKTEI